MVSGKVVVVIGCRQKKNTALHNQSINQSIQNDQFLLYFYPMSDNNPFTPIEKAIEHFKQNKFVIVMDDESRENEGDLIIAAQNIKTEDMAFLVRHSSGYVCVPLSNTLADKLDLPLLKQLKYTAFDNDRHGTAYTITVDVEKGTTTGISAHDRALTARMLADPSSKSTDFLKPGHICPLRAADGGVLQRRGHTEAAVDLCKLSGLPPVGVIAELVNDRDGSMMRLDDCVKFGKEHGIPIVTIESIASYLRAKQE